MNESGSAMRDIKRSAEISECGTYRWWLQRRWEHGGKIVCFVMLNPSTADSEQDDPTIRKCIAFAQAWGFSALDVRNLFPFRATKPADLKKAMMRIDVSGGRRGLTELSCAKTADLVIAAWGKNGTETARDRFFRCMDRKPVWCLGTNGDLTPVHPLYQRNDLTPIPFYGSIGLDWKDCLKIENTKGTE